MKYFYLATFVFLSLCSTITNAQKFSIGMLVMPQQSIYSYSYNYAPSQNFKLGLATGITSMFYATDYYSIELQGIYSFEKHDYAKPPDLDFDETNNYVKIAIINNFYSLKPSSKCRLVFGIGPQTGILTEAKVRIKETDKIVNNYKTTSKADVGLVCKLGTEISVKGAMLSLALRYDKGFIDLTDEVGNITNGNIGFYVAVAAAK